MFSDPLPSGKAVYNVESFYKEHGVTQRIARSPFFQPLGGLTGHQRCVNREIHMLHILCVMFVSEEGQGILVPFFEAGKTISHRIHVWYIC